MGDPIYLDYNATTPIAPEVAEAMEPFLLREWGNPSSSHAYGLAARAAVSRARLQVAGLLGCETGEVVFTSGGTESNNLAIQGVARAGAKSRRHVVTSAIEHPAVAEVCRWLENQGFEVSWLPVDGEGLVSPDDLSRAIRSDTCLVTVMHANNEVGSLQPVAALAEIAHRHGALMHTDAAQSVGKVPALVQELGVDLLSVAGHKLYGPKGVGALYVRAGVELERVLFGASHEQGRRPGTENVLEIVGLGQACALAQERLEEDMSHSRRLRDLLHEGLAGSLGDGAVRLNGPLVQRLPNTASLSLPGVDAGSLLAEIGDRVAASAGAACHAGGATISAVLAAMGVPEDRALGTIRFSVGRQTTETEIHRAVEVVASAARGL